MSVKAVVHELYETAYAAETDYSVRLDAEYEVFGFTSPTELAYQGLLKVRTLACKVADTIIN